MSLIRTTTNQVNHRNIIYISYIKKPRTARLHFIGGETIDVSNKDAYKIVEEADRVMGYGCKFCRILEGRLDDVITCLAKGK
jgi:hypothetical protein